MSPAIPAREQVDAARETVLAFPTHDPSATEHERVIQSHARHYLALIGLLGPQFTGGGAPDEGRAQLAALRTAGVELGNLLAVIDHGLAREQLDWLLPLATHLRVYLDLEGEYKTLATAYERLLACARRLASPALELQAQLGLARALTLLGRTADARSAAGHAQQLAVALNDGRGITAACHAVGSLEYMQGNFAAAGVLMDQALALQLAADDLPGQASSLVNLGSVNLMQRQYAEALAYYDEALRLQRQLGDRAGEAGTITNLGNVEWFLGNNAAASEFFAQGLAFRRELGDRSGIARSLIKLGLVEIARGDLLAAHEIYGQALNLERELGNVSGQAHVLQNLGNLECLLGHPDVAAGLYAQSLTIRLELGARKSIAINCACAGAALAGCGAWQAAVVALAGGKMQLEQAGYSIDPDDVPILEGGQAQLDEAVETGAITPVEMMEWRAEGSTLPLNELAQRTLLALSGVEHLNTPPSAPGGRSPCRG